MKKLILLTLSVLFATSFTLTAQSTNTETTQQKVQPSNNANIKGMKQNPSFISERQTEKTSTNKMMNNCPMMKGEKMDSTDTKSKDDTTQYNLNTSAK